MTGLGLGVESSVGLWADSQRDLTNPNANDVKTQANRAMCDLLATAPGQVAAQWTIPGGAGTLFCKPYYEQNGDEGPTEAPPFTGGQCSGTRYSLRITYTPVGGGSPVTITQGSNSVWGPISNVSVFQISETSYNYTYSGFAAASGPGRVPKTDTGSGYAGRDAKLDRLNVISGPDDCGDPDPVISPDPTYSNPRDRENPGDVIVGGDTFPISFGDNRIDLDGDAYITVDVGGVSIPIGFDGSGPSTPAPPEEPAKEGDPVEPGGSAGEVVDVVPPEDEEEGFETIGYRYALKGISAFDSRIPGTDPVIFATTVGNVMLKLRSQTGTNFYSEPIRILGESGSIVRQDPSLKVTGVVYNHLPTFDGIRLVPLRARKRK